MGEKGKVCVTGAGGYVASWLVKLLLSKGYTVHGTVRDPQSEKNAHLMKLEKASENLKLFKVDLLDFNSLTAAITGCDGVFHVACPVPSGSVPDPEVEVVEPAVKGTLNVLEACSEANVKRVVYVSSVAAVLMNPDWPKGRVKDESCWSDKEYCKRTNNWYCFSKTEAESAAIEFAKARGLDVVSVCPALVTGPMLQSTANSSSLVLIKLLKEGYEELENRLRNIVDVRDVAEALLLAYEKPEAKGRYICTAHTIRSQDLVEILRRLYPNYNYPKKIYRKESLYSLNPVRSVNKPRTPHTHTHTHTHTQRMGEKGKVCVTGAGGYVASWLVKLLLSKGYTVHGTLRDPQNEKNSHLMKLEKASENLKLFKVDLLVYNSVSAAITGCDGVFHVASPVPFSSVSDPEVQLIEPAVKGTINVLKACSLANVKRVVVVSSGRAVSVNPDWPKGRVKDETCWSDKEHCRRIKYWYALSKTEAESEALEFAKTSGLDVVRVCPTFVLGPMLQSTTNASSLSLIRLLKEGFEEQENKLQKIVDVRDVAEALLLAYEKTEADGRYICTAHMIKSQDLVEILKTIYPNYNYPKKFTEVDEEEKLSSEKLQNLGWSYRPLEETLVDSIEGYRRAGLLV